MDVSFSVGVFWRLRHLRVYTFGIHVKKDTSECAKLYRVT